MSDLAIFLRDHPMPIQGKGRETMASEYVYELAHEGFRQYLQCEPAFMKVSRFAHDTIARRALDTWRNRWSELNMDEPSELYELRYLERHLFAAQMLAEMNVLRLDKEYAHACLLAAQSAEDQGHYRLAVEFAKLAVTAYEEQMKTEAGIESVESLVSALLIRGSSLTQLGLLHLALDDSEALLALLERHEVRGKVPTRFLRHHSCGAWLNKGMLLARLGRFAEALAAFDVAILFGQQSLEYSEKDQKLVASALINRGTTLRLLGRISDALDTFAEAMELVEGSEDETEALGVEERNFSRATILSTCGSALLDSGQPGAAVDAHTRAIEFLMSLDQAVAGFEVTQRLAVAHVNRGIALQQMGHTQEAMQDFGFVIELYRDLGQQGRHDDIARSAVLALIHRAGVCSAAAALSDALDSLHQAASLAQWQVDHGNVEMFSHLALVHTQIGTVLVQKGRLCESLAHFDLAMEMWETDESVIASSGKAGHLRSLVGRALVLLQLQQWDAVAMDLKQALSWLSSASLAGQASAVIGEITADTMEQPRESVGLAFELRPLIDQIKQLPDRERLLLHGKLDEYGKLLIMLLDID